MGYMWCMALCFRCKTCFGFNPHKVPSVTVNGTREPICLNCVTAVNPKRIANGLEPIVPLPGAYEAMDEYGSDNEQETG